MTKEDYDDFIKKLTEVENYIYKKRKPEIEARKRNNKAWEIAEKEISKIQGEKRSNGWHCYKTCSISLYLVSTGLFEKIKSEMAEDERNVLGLIETT